VLKLSQCNINRLSRGSVLVEVSSCGLLELVDDGYRFLWRCTQDFLAAQFVLKRGADGVRAALQQLGSRDDGNSVFWCEDFLCHLLERGDTQMVQTVMDYLWLIQESDSRERDRNNGNVTLLRVLKSCDPSVRSRESHHLLEKIIVSASAPPLLPSSSSTLFAWVRAAFITGQELVVQNLLCLAIDQLLAAEGGEEGKERRLCDCLFGWALDAVCGSEKGNARVLQLLVPSLNALLSDEHRHWIIQAALLCSLRFEQLECARILLTPECGGNVMRLCAPESDTPEELADVLCRPSLIRRLAELGLEVLDEGLRYPVDPMFVSENDDWEEDGSLLDFALLRKRWDVIRIILGMFPFRTQRVIAYAIRCDDGDLLTFLQRWCNVTANMVTTVEQEMEASRQTEVAKRNERLGDAWRNRTSKLDGKRMMK
jgi:hypothetical protein